ncbi:MAJOR FACILITATOR SUPERFAMILY DOMAIN-CONTAINING PROTEIN 10 [Salix viminalis]|uniref:MAJOR FACILITATOR SUPERFAMILY DOMAIN-CONTAINING PROTEIN 10 n=1 Tax=Salix viminalis TaxID=40686 RepID=A0A9Q0TBY4_SALVM|nr:MAJOR FACILITATOR SUPERFAMILY DOMAIN-CONTAINING PROTEIN 10 [Salix viminalis]
MEKLAELSHLFVTVFLSSFASLMVIPAITDVTMSAVCPGKDECSLAIYLSGFQQAIIGLGTVVMMPLIGNLSDQYGRKALLTLPMTLSIIPLVILAYSRTTTFFYAYYLLRTLTAMICEGSINCLALAYVADNVLERQRTSAFGILSGIATAAFVCGTLAARFLSTASTFQVAALVSMLAAVYMRIFLRESLPNGENLTRPILKSGQDGHCQDDGDLSGLAPVLKKIPSIQEITGLLKSSVTFSQAAVVAFFNSIAEGGMQASIMYYLKARFHFSKNQYADLMLLLGIAGMASQLVFMPLLTQLVAEEKLLAIGLLGGIADALLFSVAWSNWVPYATTMFAVFMVFVPPCLRSIASKQVGPTEQGKAQGCISGIISFAKIISPLIYSPLTALFLSEDAPFHFPGFSILCIGFATMIAFFQSVLMRGAPPISSHKISNSLLA